jgi:endoglucanase
MRNKLLFFLFFITLPLYASWSEYKARFLTEDGRVIDRKNSDITHSEAVGYGMYLALKNQDMKSFLKIHQWYKNNLKKNKFGLIAWEWGKDKEGKWHTLDKNNASDGDLWIAYDNLLAYAITKDEKYKKEAVALMQSIKKNLLLKNGDRFYLLPGKYGYETEKYFEINLSYYLFFIFDKFYEVNHDIVWKKLKKEGVALLFKARFTPLKLSADWIKINKKDEKISLSKNCMFGYDAIRIPLNILMSDLKKKRELLEPYKNYVDGMKKMHLVFGVTNLKKGTISMYDYAYAHLDVYNKIDNYFYHQDSFTKDLEKLKRERKDDYYSYSLYLISTTYK